MREKEEKGAGEEKMVWGRGRGTRLGRRKGLR